MKQLIHKVQFYRQKYPIPAFLILLAVLFLLFDTSFSFLIAAAAPGGSFYIPLIDHHLDFVAWFEQFLLNSGGHFASFFGYEYFIDHKTLVLVDGAAVTLGYTCIGFGIISFYAAFILAFPQNLSTRMYYLIPGILAIVAMNVMRIGGLAVILDRQGYEMFTRVDHHTIFNVLVYIAIFIIFFFYTRGRKSGVSEATLSTE